MSENQEELPNEVDPFTFEGLINHFCLMNKILDGDDKRKILAVKSQYKQRCWELEHKFRYRIERALIRAKKKENRGVG